MEEYSGDSSNDVTNNMQQQCVDSQLWGTHPQHLLRLLSTLHSHLLTYCTHHQFEEVCMSGIHSVKKDLPQFMYMHI